MNQFNIKKIKIIQDVPPVGTKDDRWAIDIEMYGMDGKRLHRPTGSFASLAATRDGKTVYIITDKTDIKKFLKNIDTGVWLLHNAKFDIFHLRRYAKVPQRKRIWDTMLIEQIMWSGYYDDFSLADLTRRYLNIYMPKEVREQFGTTTTMSQEQIEYAAIDVVATWMVYHKQKEIIDECDLNIWKDIERPFMWTILGMSGIRLDTKAWTKLAENNRREADKLQKKYDLLNLNSPAQVKKELHKLKFKLESTGEAELIKIVDECPFASDVLAYRTYSKRASTYGTKFITDFVEDDGHIYGDLFQMGAVTARTACRAPNLQNQPHEPAYRDCFIADEDECLIVADWSSQEPRIAAFISQDENLINIFNEQKDLYIEVARLAFNEVIDKKKDKERRNQMKSLVLGIFYGISAFGLSSRVGVDKEEAQDMIDRFFDAFPGVANYVRTQQKSDQFVTSIYGRKMWLNKYQSGWERNTLNYPIQSSAADAMKLAARRFLDVWVGDDFYCSTPLKLLVHDEIVIGVPKDKKDAAIKVLQDAMVSVANEMHEGIPGAIEIFSGDSWACKS